LPSLSRVLKRNGMKRLAGTWQQSEDVWFGNKKEIKNIIPLISKR
jgi:hypothetical protein